MIDYIDYVVCYPNGWCLRIGKRLPPKRILFFKVYVLSWDERAYVGGLRHIAMDYSRPVDFYVYGAIPAILLRVLYWLRDKVYGLTLYFLKRQGFFATKVGEQIRWKDFMVLPRV